MQRNRQAKARGVEGGGEMGRMPVGGERVEAIATCRAGLERVVMGELRELGFVEVRKGKRAVYFDTSLGGLYRANMGLRSALSVLVPIRSFRAEDYERLYYQARRIHWHKLFETTACLRIDVNGSSPTLTHTQYTTHRVKDAIVDTFRKLQEGQRPIIDKAEPDVHIVVHLDGERVVVCIDSSGQPLFKRGYRTAHGVAPLKEDLAAGILQMLLAEDGATADGIAAGFEWLVDPLCGAGTFLFEGWMLLNRVAPNLNRRFGVEALTGYDAEEHARQRASLQAREQRRPVRVVGWEVDTATYEIARAIAAEHFADAGITLHNKDFREETGRYAGGLLVSNPPYGVRLQAEGGQAEIEQLYASIGGFARHRVWPGRMGLFSANLAAIRRVGLKRRRGVTLFNGALEGLLSVYESGPKAG